MMVFKTSDDILSFCDLLIKLSRISSEYDCGITTKDVYRWCMYGVDYLSLRVVNDVSFWVPRFEDETSVRVWANRADGHEIHSMLS
jgi:hypothetical protein